MCKGKAYEEVLVELLQNNYFVVSLIKDLNALVWVHFPFLSEKLKY